jgi:hypothetical protein
MSLLSFKTWTVFAILWALFVGFLAWSGWPRLPLDLGTDVLTRQAFDKAVRDHTLVHLGLAVVPPLIMLGVGRLLRGLRGSD